jgi:hypothetical protein
MTTRAHLALSTAALLVLGAGVLSGCRKETTDSSSTEAIDSDTAALVTDAEDERLSRGQAMHIGTIVFAAIAHADPDQAGDDLADKPTALWPAGCVTRTKDATNPRVVHLHFDHCTGPFGLVKLTGDEVVTFDKAADGQLSATFASENLVANGKPVTHSAVAEITIAGGERTVAWQGAWTRVNGKGITVSHTSDLTIKVDAATRCRVENGTAVTMVGEREVDTKLADVKLCPNADGAEGCPSGTITHTAKKSGKTVTIEFDGSDQATITGPKGNSFTADLVCTP